jgi:hypothetical protein
MRKVEKMELLEKLKNEIIEMETIIKARIDNAMFLLQQKREELSDHVENALHVLEDGNNEEIFSDQFKVAMETIETIEYAIKDMFKVVDHCQNCGKIILQAGYRKYLCDCCKKDA